MLNQRLNVQQAMQENSVAATVLTMPGPANETWVNNTAQRARWKLAIKRAVDVSGSAMALVGLSPVMLLIALMVKLQDGGPVIYRRRVVGPKGEFDAFKFRSMRADADQVLKADPELRRLFEINYKLRNDPRVTAVGAVIRRHSLDELPQLLNVLLGQMTLVGPRTITAPELTKYRDHASLLMSVKPGLTGYWQVNGRHRVSYEERVKMDVHYIKNWSLAMDLRILLETPVKVLKAEGAF